MHEVNLCNMLNSGFIGHKVWKPIWKKDPASPYNEKLSWNVFVSQINDISE